MILLDTNVVSEPMKPLANPRVQAWLDRQAIETLHLPSTGLAELLVGVELLPDGKRKLELGETLHGLLSSLFASRILPFDEKAARYYAWAVTKARGRGFTVSVGDAQIAAIARLRGFVVATRDTAPFLAMGVSVIDPWEEEPRIKAESIAKALSVPGGDDIEFDPPRSQHLPRATKFNKDED